MQVALQTATQNYTNATRKAESLKREAVEKEAMLERVEVKLRGELDASLEVGGEAARRLKQAAAEARKLRTELEQVLWRGEETAREAAVAQEEADATRAKLERIDKKLRSKVAALEQEAGKWRAAMDEVAKLRGELDEAVGSSEALKQQLLVKTREVEDKEVEVRRLKAAAVEELERVKTMVVAASKASLDEMAALRAELEQVCECTCRTAAG